MEEDVGFKEEGLGCRGEIKEREAERSMKGANNECSGKEEIVLSAETVTRMWEDVGFRV